MTTTHHLKKGVTLLEMLIVLAIITLLTGIVLPAMPFSRAEGTKTECLNNLRQIMVLATAYAYDDPRTTIGPVHPRAYAYVGAGYADYGGGPGTMDNMGWDQDFDPRTRPLNVLALGGRTGMTTVVGPGECPQFDLFRCGGNELGWQEWPGFGSNPLETETPYYRANGTSYRMNNLSFTDGSSLGIYGRSLSRIPETALTVAFMEARADQTLYTNDTWGMLEHGELQGYHGQKARFNVAYCDGHVDFANFGNGTYYPHTTPPDHPEWADRDARGTWGRLDCLPDPPFSPD